MLESLVAFIPERYYSSLMAIIIAKVMHEKDYVLQREFRRLYVVQITSYFKDNLQDYAL